MRVCQCPACIRNDEVDEAIESRDTERLISTINRLRNDLCQVEFDLSYYKSMKFHGDESQTTPEV